MHIACFDITTWYLAGKADARACKILKCLGFVRSVLVSIPDEEELFSPCCSETTALMRCATFLAISA